MKNVIRPYNNLTLIVIYKVASGSDIMPCINIDTGLGVTL